MTKLTVILATRNEHKTREIQAMLAGGGRELTVVSLAEFPEAPAVVEDAPTFAGNATKKSVELARWISGRRPDAFAEEGGRARVFVLADDSGLEVDALGGAPGVFSARFAAQDGGAHGNSPDTENNAKLLRLLADVPAERRSARFRCVLALTPLAAPVGGTELFDGVCEGRIAFKPSGGGGFGYDPLFVPVGYDRSFAELGEAVKNEISHRARALRRLKDRLSVVSGT